MPARKHTRYRRVTFRCMAGRSPEFMQDFIGRVFADHNIACMARIEFGRRSIAVVFIGRFIEASTPMRGVYYEIARDATEDDFDAYFLERRAEVENIIRDLEAKHRGAP